MARVFSALGATILAYTASPRPDAPSRADKGYIIPHTGDPDGSIPSAWFSGTSKSSLHAFLAQNLDILVITLPLTPATTHLFSTPEFRVLSQHRSAATLSTPAPELSNDPSSPPKKDKGCLLLNISRGPILDQPALISALDQGLLRGACLDVADPEPLPGDSPLWDAKNVIITPHVSALGVEYTGRAYDVLCTNLERMERGEGLVNVVRREKGY